MVKAGVRVRESQGGKARSCCDGGKVVAGRGRNRRHAARRSTKTARSSASRSVMASTRARKKVTEKSASPKPTDSDARNRRSEASGARGDQHRVTRASPYATQRRAGSVAAIYWASLWAKRRTPLPKSFISCRLWGAGGGKEGKFPTTRGWFGERSTT